DMVFFHGITTLPQFPRLVQDSSITFTPSSTASALEASANSFNIEVAEARPRPRNRFNMHQGS
ncbi:MAG: hypothetical protein ACKV19_03660, partial [Verrucomicrobiales bacterium]